MPLQLPSCDPKPLAPGLYTTDAFHRRPLFEVNGQVIRSWNEAHALHGPAHLEDINPAYVAALISGNMNAGVAPYKRIRRLPRAVHVRVELSGMSCCHSYDPLAGGAAAMEPEALHHFLRRGLVDHVQQALERHAGAIGCEHSSGLDSNAVLGALIHGIGVDAKRIHTWSHEGGGEGAPLQIFRQFHRLKPEQCHRIEPADSVGEPIFGVEQQLLAGFGAPAQLGGNPKAVALLKDQGCTILFSGFGGDQAISHNAANVPTDLVAQGRWQELRQWMGGKRATLKIAASRSLALSFRPWGEYKVNRLAAGFPAKDLLIRTLTPAGRQWLGHHFYKRFPLEIDSYLPQHESIRQRVLADWVAIRTEEETRLASLYGIVKSFPLLNELLISTLLQQDPILFGECAGRGRLLHRKAFEPFLPPQLRDNPSKERMKEATRKQCNDELLRQQMHALKIRLLNIDNFHPRLALYWDMQEIRQIAEDLLSSNSPTLQTVIGAAFGLTKISEISAWFCKLDG